jgi:pimeloyl-ACP methyl ester carboxylesterase
MWNGHNINYIDAGKSTDCTGNPPLLLIHGFGASAYHWRNNIPALSQKYHVYALDLLGFGFSDKPIIDYGVDVWRDQVLSFIREVINRDSSRAPPQPCVVAGNSLGGFTALYAAADPEAINEKLISGCILLNAACRFRSAVQLPQDRVATPSWAKSWSSALQKMVINLIFIYSKRPLRIAQVLRQVYPVQPDQVDAELVESIIMPTQHPNAAEVFFRVVSKMGVDPPVYANDLLERLHIPLLLLWGSKARHFARRLNHGHVVIVGRCLTYAFSAL